MAQRQILVLSAARTPIGAFGGTLKDTPLATLATTACSAALTRSGVDPGEVGHVVMGNGRPRDR